MSEVFQNIQKKDGIMAKKKNKGGRPKGSKNKPIPEYITETASSWTVKQDLTSLYKTEYNRVWKRIIADPYYAIAGTIIIPYVFFAMIYGDMWSSMTVMISLFVILSLAIYYKKKRR